MINYFQKHKRSSLVLVIALVVILVSSFFASMLQTAGFTVEVTDLQNEEFTYVGGDKQLKATVASGILFKPNAANEENKLPAVVLTHGYLNNRELQLQNAIELARRGFVVLTIDRGGHGNNEVDEYSNAMMNTSGMYDAVKYVSTLPYVDTTKIGISGHSMGGYTTAMTLYQDSMAFAAEQSQGLGLGLISAGLMQGWDMFIFANPTVSVGILKAMDDEFFFGSTFADGTKSICREYLQSTGAAKFVGAKYEAGNKDSINIINGAFYVGGQLATAPQGQAMGDAFRVIYESDEIHPLNHFSTESAEYVVDFFYTAFGTPNGFDYIQEANQTWWVKELFSTVGLVAFFALVFPLADLLLSLPFFATLRRKDEDAVAANELLPALKGVRKHVSYWVAGVATALFAGFSLRWVMSGEGCLNIIENWIFPQGELFPQDTTGAVATWAIVNGLFALAVTGLVWIINRFINVAKYGANADAHDENPFAAARVGGFANLLKTLLLAALIVAMMYLVVFANWAIWKVDFRFWTLDVKPFEVSVMLPTMLRYALGFGVFYVINSVLNQNYKVKNLPEWATTTINAAFNFVGILLVIAIQYGTFRTTGVLWQEDMALNYIVVFPFIPILAVATLISRKLHEKTGNAWLGGLVNTILFTVMTVANTAASYPYGGFFA